MRKPTAKKRDSADIAFESGSGNVFTDLGIENAEEEQLKVDLAVRLNEILATLTLPQTGIAKLLRVNQPHVSALRRYKLHGFSVERLMELLTRLGCDLELTVGPARPNREGRVNVRQRPRTASTTSLQKGYARRA